MGVDGMLADCLAIKEGPDDIAGIEIEAELGRFGRWDRLLYGHAVILRGRVNQ